MNTDHRALSSDQLRALLLDADEAKDVALPGQDDLQRMRWRVLAAVPRQSGGAARWGLWIPVAVTAMVLMGFSQLLISHLGLTPRSGSRTSQQSAAAESQSKNLAVSSPGLAATAPEPPVGWPGGEETGSRGRSVDDVIPADRLAVAPAVAQSRRTIHFVTPGGTRIIWTLVPGLRL